MVDYSVAKVNRKAMLVAKLMFWLTAAGLIQASNITIVSFKDSAVTIPCEIQFYNYPRWVDQDGIVYNYQTNPAFNDVQLPPEKFSRLEWASNKRDLTIKNVTLQDSGIYHCVVDSTGYYTELEVIAPPNSPALLNTTVVDNMTAIACLQDQHVTITCISKGGYPEPYLDIYKERIKLRSSKRVTNETDNTVTVTITSTFNATRENDGVNVTCESSHNQTDTKKGTSAILFLSLKPSVPIISGIHTASEESSVELQCTAAGSRPRVNISWSLGTITANLSESTLFNDTHQTFRVTSFLKTRPLGRADNRKNITCIVSHETLFSQFAVSQLINVQFAPDTVHLSGNRLITANKNNKLTLSCKSSAANPVSNLIWTQNGKELTSITGDTQLGGDFGGIIREQNLTIIPTRYMDGDLIFCIAEHYLLKKSQPLVQNTTLNLNYKPVVTIQEGDLIRYSEGQHNMELLCNASSKPQSTFKWFHAQEEISNSSHTVVTNQFIHTIKEVKRTHYGDYTCQATNSIASGNDSIHVEIEFQPLRVEIFGNNEIEANGVNKLLLTCKIGTANPAANILWLNGSTSLSNNDYVSMGSITEDTGDYGGKQSMQNITVVPTRFMDGSKILCKAWNHINSNNSVTNVTTLNINYGPITTIVHGEEKNVTEGQTDVRIICTAKSKPYSNFSWFKNGKNSSIMIGGSETEDNMSWYRMPLVNRTHAGEYTCTAYNGIGNPHSASIRLNVHYPPDVTVTTKNTTTNATGVDIECWAAGEPPNYTFSPWRQTWPGTNVVVRNQINFTSTDQPSERLLHIPFPNYQDTGVYTCTVGNGIAIGNTGVVMNTESVYLLVKSCPVVTKPILHADREPYKISTKLNIPFSVNVSFYSNVGNIQHKFYRVSNDTVVKMNDSQHTMTRSAVTVKPYETEIITEGFTLHISQIIKKEEHFGLFHLDIINGVGKVSIPLEIIAEGSPCTPKEIRIDDQGKTTITLSWIRCFHGGFEQTFVVQYSQDGLKWTNGTFIKGGLSQQKDRLNTTIDSLGPGQKYYLRMFAFNVKGMSNYTTVLNGTTNRTEVNGNQDTSAAGVIAGSLAAIIVITLFVSGVLIFRRQISQKTFKASKQNLVVDENIGIKQRQNRACLKVTGFKTMEEVNETNFGNNDGLALPDVPNKGKIYMHQILDYMKLSSVNCFENLHQEYNKLPTGLVHECLKASQACNSKKNRYRDILAYDHSRVIIKRDNTLESDYINANYIEGYSTNKKFIASQGPTEETVEDFWDMVLQENSSLIVMLTNLVENGVRKCLQYWPNDGEEMIFGNIKILLFEAKAFPDYVIRELDVAKVGDMPKRVTHVHFTAWPDKAAPGIAWHLVSVWRKVRALNENKLEPIVVHCSAGVGRTGTFIALDNLYTQLRTEGYIQPFEIVKTLRQQRVSMVQTKEQYVFLHEALAEALNLNMRPLKPGEYAAFMTTLLQIDADSGKSGLEDQFNWLNGGSVADEEDRDYSNLQLMKEIDAYRPSQSFQEASLKVCYIQNYTRKDSFIVAATPDRNSFEELWTVLDKHNIRTIINLTHGCDMTTRGTAYELNIPGIGSANHLKYQESKCGDQFSENILSIKQDLGDSTKTVKEFVLHSWQKGSTTPNDTSSVLALLNAVQSWQPFVYEAQPILIHCESGYIRSGLVCVLLAEFERIRIEEEANLLETVMRVKERDTRMIQNFEQYKFCHSAVLDYIRQFDVYMNI